MTERAINLHPHEARAAAEGRLGLIVRPVVPEPRLGKDGSGAVISSDYYVWDRKPGAMDEHDVIPITDECWRMNRLCPLGQPGDRLWGRESFRLEEDDDGSDWVAYRHWDRTPIPNDPMLVLCELDFDRWRPPVTMPRWASRFTFEVMAVDVKRVQEVSGDDVVKAWQYTSGVCPEGEPTTRYQAWKVWWNHHYAKRGLGWYANPWAWFVRVRRVDG